MITLDLNDQLEAIEGSGAAGRANPGGEHEAGSAWRQLWELYYMCDLGSQVSVRHFSAPRKPMREMQLISTAEPRDHAPMVVRIGLPWGHMRRL